MYIIVVHRPQCRVVHDVNHRPTDSLILSQLKHPINSVIIYIITYHQIIIIIIKYETYNLHDRTIDRRVSGVYQCLHGI